METKVKVIGIRFVRAFLSGFFATAGLVTISSVTTWSDLATALNGLALAGIVGGITGILMAGDKLLRWEE